MKEVIIKILKYVDKHSSLGPHQIKPTTLHKLLFFVLHNFSFLITLEIYKDKVSFRPVFTNYHVTARKSSFKTF